ncbi:MAG: hypothetical protein AABM42_03075 [Actinomycetota bacterium]
MATIDPTLDRVEFAEQILGLSPFDHQREALRRPEPVILLVGGRRPGKTLTACIAGLHAVTTRRDSDWLVTGPNADKPRWVIGEMLDLIRSSKIADQVAYDEEAMRLHFPGSGSAAIGVPPTGGQLRGPGRRLIGAHIEEAGHCPPGILRDLRYGLADRREEGAQLWISGSPWGPPDHFFHASWRLARDGDPDFWTPDPPWRSEMNPRLPRGWLERERARLNSIEAASELDGLWVEDGAQFFPRALLESCVCDLEMPPLLGAPA